MIKAIIFDFYGVLCSDDYWQFIKANRDAPGPFRDLADDVHLGRISWTEFVKRSAAESGQDPKEVDRLFEAEKINVHLAHYIEKLHEKYKTAVLSNANGPFLRSVLQRTGLIKLFDEIVISSEVGLMKPDPKIYKYALKVLGVKAQEAVFIDDSPPRAEGASKVGIKTIVYKDFLQMKSELEKILEQGNRGIG